MSFKSVLIGQNRAFTATGDNTGSSAGTGEGSNNMAGSGRNSNLQGLDSTSQIMISHKLNGNNYLQWSRNVLMFIRGKDKEQHLTWTPIPPAPDSPQYAAWSAEDNLIMTWLVHSMTIEISENYLLATNAREIWEAAKRAYSVRENTAAIAQVKRQLRGLSQGEMNVTQYFNALMRSWQQIDLYEVHQWSCHEDKVYFQKYLDRERCHDFLLGLSDKFEDVRGRIMGIKPFPSLDDALNMIKYEESRKELVQGPLHSSHTSEAAAMVSRENGEGDKKVKKRCDFCNKDGHTRDKCWKLHGKPANSKQKQKEGKGLMTSGLNDEDALQPDELHLLRRLLDKFSQEKPSEKASPSVTLAHAGIALFAALSLHSKNVWIIDSGATNHITGYREFFSEFTPVSNHSRVQVANNTFARVMGSGKVKVTSDITLHDVLFVPDIKCNLLSVKSIISKLKCLAIFDDSHCDLQDLASGKVIGSAKECDGLYYLEGVTPNKGFLIDSNPFSSSASIPNSVLNSVSMNKDNFLLWHSRLGHPSFDYMKALFPNAIKNIKFHCDTCQIAKQTRNTYPSRQYTPTEPFSLIHSDVWGPSRVESHSKARWFVTFIDDHTRFTWLFLMKNKSEVFSVFKQFFTFVTTQFQKTIKVFRSDNGKEYLNSNFHSFFLEKGIHHQTSCVHTPQQNGVAERKNRHILEVARSILLDKNVPKVFWGEAVLTATYLINRMPSKVINFKTPLNLFLEHYPVSHLINPLPPRVFGCVAFVFQDHQGKLEPKSIKCIFVGYSPTRKGYKCYHPITRKMYISANVKFEESQSFYPKLPIQGENDGEEWLICDNRQSDQVNDNNQQQELPHTAPTLNDLNINSPQDSPQIPANDPPQNPPQLPANDPPINSPQISAHNPLELPPHASPETQTINQEIQEMVEDHTGEARTRENSLTLPRQGQEPQQEADPSDLQWPIALRKGKRSCTRYPIGRYVSYERLTPTYKAFVSAVDNEDIPKTFEEAMTYPHWRQAIEEELKALAKNRTWEINDLPKGKFVVGSKWVFTKKYNPDGSVNKYKARLVARGFTQTYGIDYQETFAPVAKFNTINVLLSLATNLDWPLHQLDVKNAFLNGDLEEEVYMEIPLGLRNLENATKVCRLKKSLYGLKQSPRAWFERFNRAVKGFGYNQCQTDHTLFVKLLNGKITVLIVYVDDIVLTGNDPVEIDKLKARLAAEFEVKDLGYLRYFLGLEIARSQAGISVSQRKYTLDLLKETGMLGAKPAETPMELNCRLEMKPEGKSVNKERYQRLVGKLIYLSHTRPDISYAVGVVSQFASKPQKEHEEAVFRILRYLKANPGKGLFFSKNSRKDVEVFTDGQKVNTSSDGDIEVFTDADWAGAIHDRRSTTGYCTFVWGNLVTWRSKKQPVVSRSSAESEYRALALGICEGIWIVRLLQELGLAVSPIKMWCDSMAALKIANNPVQHDRTKHVEIDRHFIKEKIDSKVIDLSYVPSGRQVADMMTKPLVRAKFDELLSKLRMINIYSSA